MGLFNRWYPLLVSFVPLILFLPISAHAATYYVVSNLSIDVGPSRTYFGGSSSSICAGSYGLNQEQARESCMGRLPASYEVESLGQHYTYSDPQRASGSNSVSYAHEVRIGSEVVSSGRGQVLTIQLVTRTCTDPKVPGPTPGSCIDPEPEPEPQQCEVGREIQFWREGGQEDIPGTICLSSCEYVRSGGVAIIYEGYWYANFTSTGLNCSGEWDGGSGDPGADPGDPGGGDPGGEDPGEDPDPGGGDPGGDDPGQPCEEGEECEPCEEGEECEPGGLEGVAQDKTLREIGGKIDGSNERLDSIKGALEGVIDAITRGESKIVEAIGKIPGGGGGKGGGSGPGDPGGEPCEGDDCGPGGGGEFSGGTCVKDNVQPPTCTHEQDAVQCAIAMQAWHLRCDAQLRHEELLGEDGWGSDESLLNPDHPGNVVTEWDVDISDYFDGFDDSGFLAGSGSCPVYSASVLGFQLEFDMAPICDLAEMIGALILAVAYFWAGRIFLNGVL